MRADTQKTSEGSAAGIRSPTATKKPAASIVAYASRNELRAAITPAESDEGGCSMSQVDS